MPDLQFPLSEQTKYPGRISFQVIETTGYGINVGDVQSSQVPNSVDNGANAAAAADTGVVASLGNLIDLGGSLFNSTFSNSEETLGKVVDLYLPAGVQVQDGVQFDNVDFGVRGAAAFDNAGSMKDVVGKLINPLGEINALTEAMRNSPNKGEYASAAASAIAQRAGTVTGAVVSSALQTTTNPNTRAVFKQVPLREFTFSFKMLPQSQREAQEIIDIVGFFRELLGSGTLLGIQVLGDPIEKTGLYSIGYENNGFMLLSPMALIVVGLIIWVQRSRNQALIEEN